MIVPRPLLQSVTPKRPKFRGARGDLEPVVANEEEVVRAILHPEKVPSRDGVPTKYVAKDLRRNAGGYVQ